MAEGTTTATTEVPHKEGGFPPFDTTTFPSQLFWLVVTFGFLFLVLWRLSGPRINSAITNRRAAINGAVKKAADARAEAEAAQSTYASALAGARGRAASLAEETRQAMAAEIAKAKAAADAEAAGAMAAADARIASTREAARGHVKLAAQDAAIAIVEHLTGEKVSADEAAKAIGA